jgi:hypothetical protein
VIKINSLETRRPSKWARGERKPAHVFQKAYREKTSTTIIPAVTRSGSTLDVRSQIPCRKFFACLLPKKLSPCDAGDKVATIIKLICAHISSLEIRERF